MYLGNKSVITALVRSNFDRDYFFSKIFTASRSSYQAPAKILSLGGGSGKNLRGRNKDARIHALRNNAVAFPYLHKHCTLTHPSPVSCIVLLCSDLFLSRLKMCTAVKYMHSGKEHRDLRGRPILFITRMTTDRIGLHSVLIPLSISRGWLAV